MKKISILFFILLFVATAYGQELSAPAGQESKTPTDKGSFLFGGTFNILSLFGNFYENSLNVVLNPFGSYFIKNNIMLGGMFQLVLASQEGFSQTGYNFGPTVGYTFKKFKQGEEIEGAFIPYAKVGLLLTGTTNKFDNFKATTSGISIPIGGGFMYMLARTFGLMVDFAFSFDSMKFKDNGRAMAMAIENGALGGNRIFFTVGIVMNRF